MKSKAPRLEYVRTGEFVKRLQVSAPTFRKWRRAGQVPPPLPLPGAPRWAKPVVEAFIASLRDGTAA